MLKQDQQTMTARHPTPEPLFSLYDGLQNQHRQSRPQPNQQFHQSVNIQPRSSRKQFRQRLTAAERRNEAIYRAQRAFTKNMTQQNQIQFQSLGPSTERQCDKINTGMNDGPSDEVLPIHSLSARMGNRRNVASDGNDTFREQIDTGPVHTKSGSVRQQPNLITGPKYEQNSIHKILHKLDNKLNSKHYDTYYLSKHVQQFERIQNRFDRFYEAKLRYGSLPPDATGRDEQGRSTNRAHQSQWSFSMQNLASPASQESKRASQTLNKFFATPNQEALQRSFNDQDLSSLSFNRNLNTRAMAHRNRLRQSIEVQESEFTGQIQRSSKQKVQLQLKIPARKLSKQRVNEIGGFDQAVKLTYKQETVTTNRQTDAVSKHSQRTLVETEFNASTKQLRLVSPQDRRCNIKSTNLDNKNDDEQVHRESTQKVTWQTLGQSQQQQKAGKVTRGRSFKLANNSDLAELFGNKNLYLNIKTQPSNTNATTPKHGKRVRHIESPKKVDRIDNETVHQPDVLRPSDLGDIQQQQTELKSSIQSPVIEKIRMVPRGYHKQFLRKESNESKSLLSNSQQDDDKLSSLDESRPVAKRIFSKKQKPKQIFNGKRAVVLKDCFQTQRNASMQTSREVKMPLTERSHRHSVTQGTKRSSQKPTTSSFKNRKKVAPVQFRQLPAQKEQTQDFGTFLTTSKAPETKKINLNFHFKQDQRISQEYQRLVRLGIGVGTSLKSFNSGNENSMSYNALLAQKCQEMIEALGMGNTDPNSDSHLKKPSTAKVSQEMLWPSQTTNNPSTVNINEQPCEIQIQPQPAPVELVLQPILQHESLEHSFPSLVEEAERFQTQQTGRLKTLSVDQRHRAQQFQVPITTLGPKGRIQQKSLEFQRQKKNREALDISYALKTTPLRSSRHDIPNIPGTQLQIEEVNGRRRLVYEVDPQRETLFQKTFQAKAQNFENGNQPLFAMTNFLSLQSQGYQQILVSGQGMPGSSGQRDTEFFSLEDPISGTNSGPQSGGLLQYQLTALPASLHESFETNQRSVQGSDPLQAPQATLTETDSQLQVQYEFEKLDQKFDEQGTIDSLRIADEASVNASKAKELHERKVVLDKRVVLPPRLAQDSDITKQSDTEGVLSSHLSHLISMHDMNETLQAKQ